MLVDVASLGGLALGDLSNSLIVAASDEATLCEVLPNSATLLCFNQPPQAVAEVEPLAAAFEAELARMRLFVDRGLLKEMPEGVGRERSEPVLRSLQETLRLGWQRWFTKRLADFDAEWFLSFEEFETFTNTIASLQDSWQTTGEIALPPPRDERDFEVAESVFAELPVSNGNGLKSLAAPSKRAWPSMPLWKPAVLRSIC